MDIAQRTFLITGGASGLGAACARRIVELGGNAVLADLDREAGQTLAAELGEQAAFVETDVTDEPSTQRTVDFTLERFADLAGVVHCAGIVAGGRVVGRAGPHDLALFARVVAVNLIGTFNVVRLASAAMASRPPKENSPDGERGVLITTASVAAFDGQIGQAAYAASKAGVAGMTLPIARELAALSIRLVSIAPGIFDTPMMANLPDNVRGSLAEQVPFPARLGRPEEFAALATHVIENRMLNGTVLRLDGALRMAAR
jgi:NAD(P)-dependent dehydrogenase (short-subunit alcohol dehydrogenase family)